MSMAPELNCHSDMAFFALTGLTSLRLAVRLEEGTAVSQ
jgi:hypothetical protein